MTPKEKAKELFSKFHIEVLDREGTSAMNSFEAYQCALIAVDEILKICSPTKIVYSEMVNDCLSEYTEDYFFKQVKQELENL